MIDETSGACVQRMTALAADILADANYLAQNRDARSNSAYLLSLLAFEIYLKAVVHLNGVTPPDSHNYLDIFRLLPEAVQTRVIAIAQERMTTGADYSNVTELLATFSLNFVALRYPYEAYRSVSQGAYEDAGKGWVASGAPLEEATFVYHPEELHGLTFALQQEARRFPSSTASRSAGSRN